MISMRERDRERERERERVVIRGETKSHVIVS